MPRVVLARSRCKIDGAVARLGLEPRTVRNMAAAGDIPGAAKFGDTWTFDIVMLDTLVSEKERETWQNSRMPRRVATGVRASSGGGFRPGAATTDGHFAQTIQKLRASVAKSSGTE
jgi:hypothetical protein